MAPRALYLAAILARDLLPYAMKKTLSVLIGGHEVGVVGVVHVMIGAQLACTKYRQKWEEGLFLNIAKKKYPDG